MPNDAMDVYDLMDQRIDSSKNVIPAKYEPLITQWESIAIKHRTVKPYKRALPFIRGVLRGTFFTDKFVADEFQKFVDRPVTIEEITKAFAVFNKMRNFPEFYPTNKSGLKSLSFDTFFWNPRHPHVLGRSLFLVCMYKPLKKIIVSQTGHIIVSKSKLPQLTEYMLNRYPDRFVVPPDYSALVEPTNILLDFYMQNRSNFNSIPSAISLTDKFFISIQESYSNIELKPFLFKQEWVMDIFKTWLFKKGFLKRKIA